MARVSRSATTSRPPLGRAFVRVWATQTVSIIGSTLSGIGVAVHVYLVTGDTRWLGLLAGVQALPFLAAVPFLSRLDRWSRRSMLIAGDCIAAVGPVVALVLAALGRLEVWHLVAAGLVGGVGNAVQAPAANAAVPALVAPESLTRANALFQIGPAAGTVIGPAMATPLVAWFGVQSVLAVDVATFVIAVVATLATPFDDVAAEMPGSDDGSWAAALGWLRTSGRPLVLLLVAMGAVNFLLSFFNIGLLAVATDVGGAASAGIAVGLGGVAMIVGSFLTERSGVEERPSRAFAWSLLVIGAGSVLTGLRPSYLFVVVGVVVALSPGAILNAGVATLFHRRVPPSMHGRVFAVRSTISRSLDPVGSVIAGFVIASWAAPAMARGGRLSGVAGPVIGTGGERGAGLVLVLVGLGLGGIAAWLGMSSGFTLTNETSSVLVAQPLDLAGVPPDSGAIPVLETTAH